MDRRPLLSAVGGSGAVAVLFGAVLSPAAAADVDVYGTQAAAIEIPSIYGILRRPGDTTGGPLDTNSDATYAFQAYLDTGTSGIILSQEDNEAREVRSQVVNGQPVTFSDIAVNGAVSYEVSENLDLRLGRYTGENLTADVLNTAQTNAYFSQVTPNVRLQLSTTPVDPFLGTPLNLVGMPALKNKVMVVDARLYNHLTNIDTDTLEVQYDSTLTKLADYPTNALDVPLPQLQTWVYDKGDAANHAATPLFDPGVPAGQHVVRMSYADFSGFTQLSPSNAIAPTLAHNPFVGPAPFKTPAAGDPPGIALHRQSGSAAKSAGGSWLFDTGAQISFMSSAMALSLGVQLTFDTDGNPVLTDVATGKTPDGLFSVPLGGAGGEAGTLAGFTVDELDVPTLDGLIRLHDVPVGVLDVTVTDGTHTYTLDGDFGMNLLLPTMGVDASLSTASPFDFVTFDEQAGLLTLTDAAQVPEPALVSLVGLVGNGLSRRRRQIRAV